jgi:ATP-dependent Lon protease
MKESSQLSYSFAKTFLAEIEPGNTFFRNAVIHIHVPEGVEIFVGQSKVMLRPD